MSGILQGLQVVEGSAFIAAPSGGMTLAAMGADVIRFDPIGGGLDYRRWPVTEDGHSIYWRDLNKGKRSIAVDLRNPQGRELLTSIITTGGENSGLFLTNFPARGWLAYESLRQHREDLIQVSITGDRHGGTALDYTVNARAGFPFLTGPADDDRLNNNALPAWDFLCGKEAAIGLLAAERHRRITGNGQEIKLALADVAFATVSSLGYIGEIAINDDERQRHGNRLYGAFGRDFETADGETLMVVGISGRQWTSLLEATESTDAIADLEKRKGLNFRSEGDRFHAHDEIAEILEPWFADHDFAAVAEKLNAQGVCWGRYQSMRTMVEEDIDVSVDNPMFNPVEQPDVGSYLAAGSPLDFGDLDRVAAAPAPSLGEHTDEILSERLGLSDAQIGKLHDEGVVAGHKN